MKKLFILLSLSFAPLLVCSAETALPRGLSCIKPAPGRSDGRIYYYVPESLDLTKPVGLFIFLHGGGGNTPDDFPDTHYLNEKEGGLGPHIKNVPFVVAAASAPKPDGKSPDWARWNQDDAIPAVLAIIEDAAARVNLDRDRIILGGQSMGGFGAADLGMLLADKLAGVWISAGAWHTADFRAFYGTPVYIQHGKYDTAFSYRGGGKQPRSLTATSQFYARAADKLMTRDRVEHVFDEHDGGHALTWEPAQLATRRFLAWAAKQRRNPYSAKTALVTPCGSGYPKHHPIKAMRWLELVEAVPGRITYDSIKLTGPKRAYTIDEFLQQGYELVKQKREGARIVAENLGGNRFKVRVENVAVFRILLSPQMGDLEKPFTVDLGEAGVKTVAAEKLEGNPDYSAAITVKVK